MISKINRNIPLINFFIICILGSCSKSGISEEVSVEKILSNYDTNYFSYSMESEIREKLIGKEISDMGSQRISYWDAAKKQITAGFFGYWSDKNLTIFSFEKGEKPDGKKLSFKCKYVLFYPHKDKKLFTKLAEYDKKDKVKIENYYVFGLYSYPAESQLEGEKKYFVDDIVMVKKNTGELSMEKGNKEFWIINEM